MSIFQLIKYLKHEYSFYLKKLHTRKTNVILQNSKSLTNQI